MRNTWALLPGWKHALQRACGSVPEAHTWLHMDFSNPTAIWHRRGAAKICLCRVSPCLSTCSPPPAGADGGRTNPIEPLVHRGEVRAHVHTSAGIFA